MIIKYEIIIGCNKVCLLNLSYIIIPILKAGKADIVNTYAEELKDLLSDAGYDVLLDNRDIRPGEKYYYTNIGYSIIGYLVELISGQNFNEYCKENTKASLDSSSFLPYMTLARRDK